MLMQQRPVDTAPATTSLCRTLHFVLNSGLVSGERRYPVYIDAGAYVSNLKHKLAVGSPLLMVTHRCAASHEPWYQAAIAKEGARFAK